MNRSDLSIVYMSMWIDCLKTVPDVHSEADEIAALEETLSVVKDIAILSESREDDDKPVLTCRMRLSAESAVGMIIRSNGIVQEMIITEQGLRFRAEVPPTTEIRDLVDEIRGIYSDTTLLSKRTVDVDSASLDSIGDVDHFGQMTAKQRDTLETAYRTGYFEFPREMSGQEVAELLGCSSATFSEHLRAAEAKLLDSVFEGR